MNYQKHKGNKNGMDKREICFIRAKQKDDYVVPAIRKYGFKVVIPYKDYNLFLRICREAWFRLGFPCKELWYNPQIRRIEEKIIIIKDPLIVPEFVMQIRKLYPGKVIIFDYDNRVKNSLYPDRIRPYLNELWHYDAEDCQKFGLRKKGNSYLDVYQIHRDNNPEYDVFYVGRDKGRLQQIDVIKEKLESVGLKTFFHICANREFLTWTNKRYKHFLPYNDYLELLKKSKAILNIVPNGQTSITQREMEAVFDNVKCITNNKGILEFSLYDPSRFFYLENNYEKLPAFLASEFKPVDKETLEEYRFIPALSKMFQEIE